MKSNTMVSEEPLILFKRQNYVEVFHLTGWGNIEQSMRKPTE